MTRAREQQICCKDTPYLPLYISRC